MPVVKTPDLEPIPGYRLLEPLGQGGFGEVWKCEAPGGLYKAIKFVSTSTDSGTLTPNSAERELKALQHIKSIRHPFLLSMDHVELIDNELVIVMELAERSLFDVLQEHRRQGQAGIPRAELLGYLREAAEVLDLMNLEYGQQHLDVKPRNIFVVDRHVKVADFGLVNSLVELCGSQADEQLAAISPLYASPESFLGKITLYSDQYSLAVTYQELLTGTLPFPGEHFRQLAMQHLQSEPDLRALPESDRQAMAQALSKEPRQRFPSSTAFVQALDAAGPSGMKTTSLWGTPVRGSGSSIEDRESRIEDRESRLSILDPRSSIDEPASLGTTLDGYQFLECLARSSLGEVWKAVTTGGRKRLVKLLFGVHTEDDSRAERASRVSGGSVGDRSALERLRALRQRTLAETEYLVTGPGRLAVVTDLADTTLADQLKECQYRGLLGLPREQLLDYLGEAAAALEELHQAERLQHLGLTPRQLVLRDNRLFLTDFGLVELLWLPAGRQPGALNPRYAAPELFDCQISRACDQFSLALLFQELLTGAHPFRNLNPRQMANPRLRGKPDLGLLPGTDRPIVQKALDADPRQRFGTCVEFVEALREASSRKAGWAPAVTGGSPIAVFAKGEPLVAAGAMTPASLPVLNKLLRDLLRCAIGLDEIHNLGVQRFRLRPGDCLEHQCFAKLLPSTVKLKLEGFRQQWHASRLRAKSEHYTFQVRFEGKLWQHLLGLLPGLEVDIQLDFPRVDTAEQSRILLRLRPFGCDAEKGTELLEEMGPQLLESVRDYLQTGPERRRQERLPFEQTVKVFPLVANGELGEPVLCKTYDLSLGGIGLLMPSKPSSREICIQLAPRGNLGSPVGVPGRIVHAAPGRDGGYQVGVSFNMHEEKR